jgi:hypothetical protein
MTGGGCSHGHGGLGNAAGRVVEMPRRGSLVYLIGHVSISNTFRSV